MQAFEQLTGVLNDIFYSKFVAVLLLVVGIYFTIRLKFGQITNLGHMFKLLGEDKSGDKAISPFEAFCISAASRIGTGNIVGTAAAIATGGPGAVFWMWMTAIIGGATSFIESTLAQIYKRQNDDGTYRGGPAYYIKHGLGMDKLGIVFAIVISITFGFMFNAVQSNTISSAISNGFGFDVKIISTSIVILTAVVIFGGAKKIAQATSKIVPIMATFYILICLFVIITNITKFPLAIKYIFVSAFNPKAVGGAVAGKTIGIAITTGVRRGLFSNEAGMGSVPNAAATADTDHPAKQGFIQSFGVYVDTILVCTATAFIILLSGSEVYADPNLQGIQITQMALANEVGDWAYFFLAICIFMFSYSSILGNFYYGQSNIEFITPKTIYLNIYRCLVLIMVYIGGVADFSVVWNTGDIFMGIMAVINLFVILKLGNEAITTYKVYIKDLKNNSPRRFSPKIFKQFGEITEWD